MPIAEPARLGERPAPFSRYTAEELWTDDHTSARMLAFHLDATGDIASRNAAFIDRSVAWIVSRFAVGPHTGLGQSPGEQQSPVVTEFNRLWQSAGAALCLPELPPAFLPRSAFPPCHGTENRV